MNYHDREFATIVVQALITVLFLVIPWIVGIIQLIRSTLGI